MEISRFGLGSIVVDDEQTVWVRRRDFVQLLDVCTAGLGVTYLDSAQAYQKSEEAIGEWLRGKPQGFRDTLIIGSKVSRKPMDRESVRRAGHESLDKLDCGSIDIYWTHSYDAASPVLETYRGLDDLAEEGVIKEIGMCNVDPRQIREILSTCEANRIRSPRYVQNEFNLLNFTTEQETTALCETEGLRYMAFSPLAGGILTGKYSFDEPLPSDSRWGAWQKTRGLPSYWTAAGFASLARFEQASIELGVSMASLALAWCSHRSEVTTTLLGPRHIGHLDAVREVQLMTLTEAQLRQVTELFSQA